MSGTAVQSSGKSDPNNPNNDRDGRLKLRKNNEEVLRKILQAEARKKCLGPSTAFGECAKEHGLSVVFKYVAYLVCGDVCDMCGKIWDVRSVLPIQSSVLTLSPRFSRRCRAQNTAMQDCLKEHYNDELFNQFLAEHGHPGVRPTFTLTDRVSGWFK